MIEFWNTQMGRRFIEGTMPELVHQLEKFNRLQQFPELKRKVTLTSATNGNKITLLTERIEGICDEEDSTAVFMCSGRVHPVQENREKVLELIRKEDKG